MQAPDMSDSCSDLDINQGEEKIEKNLREHSDNKRYGHAIEIWEEMEENQEYPKYYLPNVLC